MRPWSWSFGGAAGFEAKMSSAIFTCFDLALYFEKRSVLFAADLKFL